MSVFTFDLETSSGRDISHGLPNYFSEARVICGSYEVDGKAYGFYPDERPARLLDHVANRGFMRAWNVSFDWRGWNKCLVEQHDYPPLPIEHCFDTMAQAAAQNLPQALGKCAEVLGLPQDKQKDRRGKTLIRKVCIEGSTDPKLVSELFDYCVQDSVVEAAIAKLLRPLSAWEREVWLMTHWINENGLPVNPNALGKTQEIIDAELVRLEARLKQVTQWAVNSLSNLNELKAWLRTRGLSVDSLAAEAIDEVLSNPLEPDVREAIEIRKTSGKSSLAKIQVMRDLSHKGRINGLLTYHGASTGRFASKGGLNAQNLPRPSMKDTDTCADIMGIGCHDTAQMLYGDDVLEAAVSSIRAQIVAPEGKRFICADYSSVENRVGAWISDHQEIVDAFAKGLDEYKVFASKNLYDLPYEEVTSDMRQVAKSAVLGCLFGQGAKSLVEYAKNYGVTLTLEQAKTIVDDYRQAYAPVADTWKALEVAALKAVRLPGKKQTVNNKINLICKEDFLYMVLPSKRPIAWYKPRIETKPTPWGAEREQVFYTGKLGTTSQWGTCSLYGGTIFQSAVQATARDILVHGVKNVKDAGYEVCLLVHDEVLALADIGFGSGDELGELMCQAPTWAIGLPLAYEAWEGKRYRK